MWDILKDFFSFLPKLFIIMHTTGFEMIGEFSYDDLGMSILWLFFGIILIIMVLFLDVMMIFGIRALIYKISVIIRTKKVKRKKVVGTVISKEYEVAYTTYQYNIDLKTLMPMSYSEEYNVKIEYDGVFEIFNNRELFKKYKEGDDISLMLIQRRDKNNKIIEQKLEVSE